jgi:hypothetical protein
MLKRVLSEDCFEDGCKYGAGHFWGILQTRPYMRVLQAIVEFAFSDGQYDLSAQVPSLLAVNVLR